MERRGHRQQHAPLGALRRGDLQRAFDRFLVAGDHDLLGPVEIDGFHDARAAGAGLAAHGRHGRGVEAEDRRHRADARRHGLLHRLRAEPDERQRIGEGKRARGDERAVFAETVARDDGRPRASRGEPGAPDGDTGRQHHRLRVDRLVEVGFRTRRHQRPEVLPQHRRRFVERRADRGMRVEARHHPDGLRALPRKYDRDLHFRIVRHLSTK